MRLGIWVQWRAAAVVLALTALAAGGCRRPAAATAAPPRLSASTQPAIVGGGNFRSDPLNVELTYPSGWVAKKSPDFVWMAVPTTGSPAADSLSLDVPSLPVHLPGMIPISLVKNGYLDDLKKDKTSFTAKESSPTVPSAKARLVQSTWSEQGQSKFETALLLVHGDRVYIVRADGLSVDESRIATAFDEVSRSLRWLK
jgi:hypothetical protein